MKTNTVKNATFACAISLGLGISFLLPLASNGGEIIKGGPQMMKRSEAYFPAARKPESRRIVLTSQSCCDAPVGCCAVKIASPILAELK